MSQHLRYSPDRHEMDPFQVEQTGVARMDAHIKVLNGPSSGQMIPVRAGKLIIGREEDCHLRPPSEFVSRHHCVLLLDDYTLRIRDLGSKNGTFVNNKRVGSGEMILMDGDLMSVGEMICQISLTSAAPDGKRAVPDAQPNVLPPAMERTRVIDGDTVQSDSPNLLAPAPPPSAPAP
jgi:pSer/pThr/pTyr-binding forkhead associated (FHA) protein